MCSLDTLPRKSASKVNDKKYEGDLKGYYNNKIRKFNDILGYRSRTSKRTGEQRYYWQLLKHRFDLEEKIKIQRQDDGDIISDKIFDFSYDTIDQLIKKGIDDALEKIFEAEKEKHNNSVDDACNELQRLIEDIKAVNTNEDQYLIEAAGNIIINECKK